MDDPILPIILCVAPAALILLSRHPLGLSLANKMDEAELKVAAFVTIQWYSCLPLLPLPSRSPSLMPSSPGLWNAVPGNKSIELIISLYNGGTTSLSETVLPTEEGWCNLMWRENGSSILQRAAAPETALFHPADASGLHRFSPSLPAFSARADRDPLSRGKAPAPRCDDVCMLVEIQGRG